MLAVLQVSRGNRHHGRRPRMRAKQAVPRWIIRNNVYRAMKRTCRAAWICRARLGEAQWLLALVEEHPKLILGMALDIEFHNGIQGPAKLKQVRRPNSG